MMFINSDQSSYIALLDPSDDAITVPPS